MPAPQPADSRHCPRSKAFTEIVCRMFAADIREASAPSPSHMLHCHLKWRQLLQQPSVGNFKFSSPHSLSPLSLSPVPSVNFPNGSSAIPAARALTASTLPPAAGVWRRNCLTGKSYLQQKATATAATAAAATRATTMAKQYGKLYKNLPGHRPSGPAAGLMDKRSEKQQQQQQQQSNKNHSKAIVILVIVLGLVKWLPV
ncbi:hypothetical protein AWZ03_001642 [Drosophila navojoa]|uniref:Uncharacterized protein n=1 Tax=Drosophila navojoa TaxID=7232 RepID=A0A484BVC3_DRONA|nr:hypothetical protein AWZ03_001642 [Drosophila navojoa]